MGRGASKAGAAAKKRGSILNFIEKVKNDPQNALSQISSIAKIGTIGKAKFTANGNAIQSQKITFESGDDKLELYFYSEHRPEQVTPTNKAIKTGIYANTWKNGNVTAVRTLYEKKTKSIKNSKKNYEDILEQWKKATNQSKIRF